MNSAILNEVLFDLDPAGTACKENDAFDEYESIAAIIIERVREHSEPIDVAIRNSFNDLFWSDILTKDQIDAIVEQYNETF